MAADLVSVQFTEDMKGYVGLGETADYQKGFDAGKAASNFFWFHLTIKVPDIQFFVRDPEKSGTAEGWIQCEQFGGRRPVERGFFNCFVDVGAPQANTRNMRYRLFFRDAASKPLTLSGHKVVIDDGMHNIWRDTSTLYSKVFEGHVEMAAEATAPVVATGILHIEPLDFAKQMTTFTSSGATFEAREQAMATFGRQFLGTLWDVYKPRVGSVLTHDGQSRPIPLFSLEGVKDADVSTHYFATPDKLGLSLLRFLRKPCEDVVVLIHGLTTSTDMFIMPEHVNLVSYLLDHGFTDVWSLDWRGSMRHSYDLFPGRFNLDDIALYDMPGAIGKVREVVGPGARIHVICHCVGSIAFLMSLFAGLVDGVTSVVSNSVSLTPRVSSWSNTKLALAPFVMNWILRFPNLNPRWSSLPGPGVPQGKLVAKIVSLAHSECKVPACHMVSFMWGDGHPAVWRHENLSDITHQRTGDLFGAVNINYYLHLRKMVQRGAAVKYDEVDPRYSHLPNNYLDRAPEVRTPVLFMTGDQNRVFQDSNIIAFNTLARLAPGNKHELKTLAGYGHQDPFMGVNNHLDVFPLVVDFLNRQR
jgi:triacylglycerol lipase/cholesterol oxidase